MKNKLKFIVLIIIIAATATGVVTWRRLTRDIASDGDLTLYGKVELRDAQLAFNEQEYIREILVEEGDVVEPGQVLARLDTSLLDAQLAEAKALMDAQREILQRLQTGPRPQEIAQAEAEVQAANVDVENARKRVNRLQQTSSTGATTQQDLDDATAALNIAEAALNVRQKALELLKEGFRSEEIAEARARLAASEARIEIINTRLEDTSLAAPSAGTVQSRIMEPGEMTRPGQAVLVIALTEPKWIRAYLPEPQLGRVRNGMPAHILSDSFPGKSYNGSVSFISPEAEFTPKTVQTEDLRTHLVYEIRILVDDPENELRLGMPVTVKLPMD